MNLKLKDILRDCHKSMINSSSVSGSIYSDTKIICEDGSINYSKLLLNFVDPVLVNILQDANEDDCYQKIVLCPDFQKEEFIETWHAILFKSDDEFAQDSFFETSNVIKTELSVQSNDKDSFQFALSEESSVDFDDHDPVSRRISTDLELKSNNVLCNFCGRSFPNETKLKKHFYNVHHTSKNKFECFECKKRFSSKTFLLKHKSSDHKEVIKKCPKCLKIFTTIAEYKLHEFRHKEFECQVCGKTNSNKFNYERHLLSHDKTQKFECEFCKKRFSLKHQLDRHKQTHTHNESESVHILSKL